MGEIAKKSNFLGQLEVKLKKFTANDLFEKSIEL
jgi:hypothetical protein